MPSMQTPDRIIASSTHPIYVIDWNCSPEHGAPDGLPPPVREWLEMSGSRVRPFGLSQST